MAKNGNSQDFNPDTGKKSALRSNPLHPFHEAALKLAGMGLNRSQSKKTRDIVSMLLSHGARAWRASQPEISLHLHVVTPRGKHPVRLRLR
jgi:hypothetical protein